MSFHFIKDQDFPAFLSGLIKARTVVGPVAKTSRQQEKFVFARLTDPAALRLDYDVTILPPKKEFFPPKQNLLLFDGPRVTPGIEPEEKVLFGVHPYDMKALDMTDALFREKNEDRNYTAHREAATVVVSSVQKVSPRAFWASIGTEVKPKGHDAWLTKVAGGCVYEAVTAKGEALLQHGKFAAASEEQKKAARRADEEAARQCPEKLQGTSASNAKKVRAAFSREELWTKFAQDCFSCGSCNTVCPTCYCFDVQDWWHVDQNTGGRTRTWDSCLTEDFAKISLGAGAQENFREERAERFRHRFMRKAAYLNEKLGGPACVGCGRCSAACTADIADPTAVINSIPEA
ncbi:MAG: 4Fe-4S dicluster domain-containing protein [Elusimicrobia bacterium]|jgi:ferredoxin|nr:4Fe-4S dicluster domain-containing protein [Elusimicrobiota bacterium]